jgi:hypothetical protein
MELLIARLSGSALTIGVCTAAAAVAVVLVRSDAVRWFLFPDLEDACILDTNADIRLDFLGTGPSSQPSTTSDRPSRDIRVAYDETLRAYNFQRRIAGPLLMSMNFPERLTLAQRAMQKKEFVWIAGSNEDWHIGLALLQFQFIGVLVVNVWDVKHGVSWARKVEVPLAALLGAGPHFRPSASGHCAPGSDGHDVTFGDDSLSGGCRASVRFVRRHQNTEEVKCVAFVSFSGDVNASPNSAPCMTQASERQGVRGQRAGPRRSSKGRRFVEFEYAVEMPAEYLNMVFPIGPHRASMVAKFAGAATVAHTSGSTKECAMHTAPRIRWDRGDWASLDASRAPQSGHEKSAPSVRPESQPFLVSMDYTRGLLRRETTWYWACMNCVAHRRTQCPRSANVPTHHHPRSDNVHQIVHLPDDRSVDQMTTPVNFGFHLSSGTYDDNRSGVSFESTVFIDGRVVLFQLPVKFTHDSGTKVSTSTLRSNWKIEHDSPSRTDEGLHDDHRQPNRLQLTFTPADGHLGHFNYIAIRGALLHYWGMFSGSVWVDGEEYVIRSAPGVIEDHYALW